MRIKKPICKTNRFKKIGSQLHTLPEHSQIHKKIEFFTFNQDVISELFVQLYENGLSLADISKQTGKSKSMILKNLNSAGIKLRRKSITSISKIKSNGGKTNIKPPYGFCFFQGQVVHDQNEYENLMLIYQLWCSDTNPNRISDVLNQKKIIPRFAKIWNRNSIVNILSRFEKKQIIFKGGQLELR